MRYLKYLLILLVALIAVYGGLWYMTANKISTALNDRLKQQDGVLIDCKLDEYPQAGYKIMAKNVKVSGFPFAYEVSFNGCEDEIKVFDNLIIKNKIIEEPIKLRFNLFNGDTELLLGNMAESYLNNKMLIKFSADLTKMTLIANNKQSLVGRFLSPFDNAFFHQDSQSVVDIINMIFNNYKALSITSYNSRIYDATGKKLLSSLDALQSYMELVPRGQITELKELFNLPKKIQIVSKENNMQYSDVAKDFFPHLKSSTVNSNLDFCYEGGAKTVDDIALHDLKLKFNMDAETEILDINNRLSFDYQPVINNAAHPTGKTALDLDFVLQPKDGMFEFYLDNITGKHQLIMQDKLLTLLENYEAYSAANFARDFLPKVPDQRMAMVRDAYKKINDAYELDRLNKAATKLVIDADANADEAKAEAEVRRFELDLANLFVIKLDGKASADIAAQKAAASGKLKLEKASGLIDLYGRAFFIVMKEKPDNASLQKFNEVVLATLQKISDEPNTTSEDLTFSIEVDSSNLMMAKFGSQNAVNVPGIISKSLSDAGINF